MGGTRPAAPIRSIRPHAGSTSLREKSPLGRHRPPDMRRHRGRRRLACRRVLETAHLRRPASMGGSWVAHPWLSRSPGLEDRGRVTTGAVPEIPMMTTGKRTNSCRESFKEWSESCRLGWAASMIASLLSIAGFHQALTLYRETVNRRSVTSDLIFRRDSSRNRAWFNRLNPSALTPAGPSAARSLRRSRDRGGIISYSRGHGLGWSA